MKTWIKHFGAMCAGILVFALAMLIGAGVPVTGWLLWYLFALAMGTVGGMIAWAYETE